MKTIKERAASFSSNTVILEAPTCSDELFSKGEDADRALCMLWNQVCNEQGFESEAAKSLFIIKHDLSKWLRENKAVFALNVFD